MPNKSKRGLGRGFEALIPTQAGEAELGATALNAAGRDTPGHEAVEQIATESIVPNPHQPRKQFEEQPLQELASSIKTHGIVQPLVAVRAGSGRYELIAGERRLRAAKLVGLAKVPVIVRSTNEQQQLEVALIENLQRTDLNAMEKSNAYNKLTDEFNLTTKDIARQLGKSEPTIRNTIRMVNLPIEAKRALMAGEIVEAHARQILAVPNPTKQLELLALIKEHKWKGHEAEHFTKVFKRKGRKADDVKAWSRVQPTNELTQDLEGYLGAKVFLEARANGGRMVVEYYSDEELQRIYETIKGTRPPRKSRARTRTSGR